MDQGLSLAWIADDRYFASITVISALKWRQAHAVAWCLQVVDHSEPGV